MSQAIVLADEVRRMLEEKGWRLVEQRVYKIYCHKDSGCKVGLPRYVSDGKAVVIVMERDGRQVILVVPLAA